VTKFHQNRSRMKGRSARERHTYRQTNSAENIGPSGLQSGQKYNYNVITNSHYHDHDNYYFITTLANHDHDMTAVNHDLLQNQQQWQCIEERRWQQKLPVL